ncbi:MAG TPA: adenylate kinase [Bryobacteraceae bacterium]|nr:adenylate kinase [Bryobacteraceae bacterium]
MIILLFGPPGCGKGTQAVFLAERLQIPAISTGEMFRAECKAGTDLGRKACSILSNGGLVGDEIVNGIVANRITRPDCANGFLLDGYPRTLPQAMQFSALLDAKHLPEPIVIHLDVPETALVSRLTARRQCPKCLRIYNLLSQPPQVAEICDADGASLLTREDDKEEVIRQRLRAYHDLTGPILNWYGKSLVRRIDGEGPPRRVAEAIQQAVLSGGVPFNSMVEAPAC